MNFFRTFLINALIMVLAIFLLSVLTRYTNEVANFYNGQQNVILALIFIVFIQTFIQQFIVRPFIKQ